MNNEQAAMAMQGSAAWHLARLGHITSSQVYKLMGKGRAKDAEFSQTGISYLLEIAAERNLKDSYINDDMAFQDYLDRVNASSKAMRYGTETEPVARKVYAAKHKELRIEECGFVRSGYHSDVQIDKYGDSPDGLCADSNTGEIVGCIEIKCPMPNTWMAYRYGFKSGKTLKEVEEAYYWQCQSHCLCNNVQWCDFIFFDKMQKNGFQCIRVERNDEDIKLMVDKIQKANKFIDDLLNE